MVFKLDNRLEQDCHELGSMKLCKLLLANDKQFPWFILVPKREQITEIHQLENEDLVSLMIESKLLSRALESIFQPDKINIASIGNIVSQLHVHHVARFKSDIAWPKPIWGMHDPVPYEDFEISAILEKIKGVLGRYLVESPRS